MIGAIVGDCERPPRTRSNTCRRGRRPRAARRRQRAAGEARISQLVAAVSACACGGEHRRRDYAGGAGCRGACCYVHAAPAVDASIQGHGLADPDAIARYLNRLAVDPRHQGLGIGRWCLEQVAEECARDGATAVRCDVLQANVPLRRFYERHGYEARGERFHSGWYFAVYERVLRRRDTA